MICDQNWLSVAAAFGVVIRSETRNSSSAAVPNGLDGSAERFFGRVGLIRHAETAAAAVAAAMPLETPTQRALINVICSQPRSRLA